MELYDIDTYNELMLRMRAGKSHTPAIGSFELLPLCNMDCRMCYVHLSREDLGKGVELLSCREWLHIAEEGCKKGLLFLLLTGGEPLLYPEFDELYSGLRKMGIFLLLNTNGTLIDRSKAKLFSENGVKRINITLYGPDNETYGELCGNPHGFDEVVCGAELLREYNVPFRFTCSLTPQNIAHLPEMIRIANELKVPFETSSYMMPAVRRGMKAEEQFRLSPEQAAESLIERYKIEHPGQSLEDVCRETILSSKRKTPKFVRGRGFACQAGKSGFWVNWMGEMSACGIFSEPSLNLREHSFEECWKHITSRTEETPICKECVECEWQNLCMTCPAACYSETGFMDGRPEYLCRMTREWVRIMASYLPEAEAMRYLETLPRVQN